MITATRSAPHTPDRTPGHRCVTGQPGTGGSCHPCCDVETSARTLTDALHALGWHDQARRLLEEARIDAATHPRRTPGEPG